jgi:transposase
MDLRVQLIQDYEDGESVSGLAEVYGVSRKTVYKWLARHAEEGAAGLGDRSRVPPASPHRLADEVVAHIVAARQRWKWGPRKLRVKLAAAHPQMAWPAESTIGEVLKRAGLTHRRKLRVRTPPYAQPFASIDAANQTWCADFKGWFRTSDGTRCDPLTITDAHRPLSVEMPYRAQGRHNSRDRHLRGRISGTRTAAGDPYRQRCSLRQPRTRRTEPRFDAMGEVGHSAGTLTVGFAPGQRPA